MAKKIAFPRHVYKKNGPIEWNRGITYSKEYVVDKTEYDAALKAGYIDDFNEALLGDSSTVEGDFEVEEPKKKGLFSKEKKVEETSTIDDDF